MAWEGSVFVDRALPFGLSSAPKLFSAVADVLAWALHCKGVRFQLHYLDDFLLLGKEGIYPCDVALASALEVFGHLGVPVAPNKVEGPSPVLTFLGIVIDAHHFQLRLPLEKLDRLQEMLGAWLDRKSCRRRELESLLGHLSHAATVVRPGRTFLRGLFSLLKASRAPYHFIHLSAQARGDLHWWRHFLQSWNGTAFFPLPVPSVHIYSDASGTFGCGALWQGQSAWLQLQWPPDWAPVSISPKELVPIVLATAVWGHRWEGHHVCFHCDNEAVVQVLNSHSSREPLMAHLLRCYFFYAAYFKFSHSAKHVPGIQNSAADALSRGNMLKFISLFPQGKRSAIPQQVKDFVVNTNSKWGSSRWTEQCCHSLMAVLPPPLVNPMHQASAAT